MRLVSQGWLVGSMVAVAVAAMAAEAADKGAPPAPKQNVVLITLDGVRWREVFHGTDPGLMIGDPKTIFTHLNTDLGREGILYGDKARGDRIEVANNSLNSLPGYQSIMSGHVQPCHSNICGRIRTETLQERLVNQGDINMMDVATIASWTKIANAAEHISGTTFVNAGVEPLDDRESDRELNELNRMQELDTPPWGSARADKYTFAQGLRYLKMHHPRFLHIALNDSDEWGHRGNYDNYVATCRQYDTWVKQVADTLDSLGEYGKNTTLIVTTDHGRGDGNDWSEHGSGWPASRDIWFYARNERTRHARNVAAAPTREYTHLDLRPTIEALIGLPRLEHADGAPIPELTGIFPPKPVVSDDRSTPPQGERLAGRVKP